MFDNGQPQLDWPTPFSSIPYDEWDQPGTVQDFEVTEVQLDDDPELEVAVATLTRRNDLGMSWWNLALLDGRAATTAIRLDVANYGQGTFVSGRGGACDILASSWELDRRPGAEGVGYYLTVRPMSLDRGELVPNRQQPLWMRRLLDSFQPGSQRRPSGLTVGTPATDLAHAKTESRQVEPYLRVEYLRDIPLHINSARPATRSEAGQVHLVTTKGTVVAGQGARLLRLGDQRTGRLFPAAYRPAASLSGRPAVLSEYANTWG